MKVKGALMLAGALAAAGCSSPDRAVFVTSTNIGINADATSRVVNLGYDRTEGFVGPGYVDTGAAPPAVGYLESNLEVFSPKIKQVYATGTAADIVTRDDVSGVAVQPDDFTGQRRVMAFGTASNVGVKLGFATSSGIPDSVTFGYKRNEASVIPFRPGDPVSGQPDKYASVLAAVDMDQSTKTMADTSLRMVQFVATGTAAQNLAKSDRIRDLFRDNARKAMSLGEVDAQNLQTQSQTLAGCVSTSAGTLDAGRLATVLQQAQSQGRISQSAYGVLGKATSTQDLTARLTGAAVDAGPALDSFVKANPSLCVQKA